MLYWFDAKKAAQAASVLLDFENGKMEYIRLLKLLYIADRESISETERPISYSQSVAMEHGPLSSEVYSLICGERDEGRHDWAPFIRTHGHNITLVDDPGRGKLSKYEIEKLNEVSRRFESIPSFRIVDDTHAFKEWIDNCPPADKSRRIPFPAILDALGFTNERKEKILAEMTAKARADRLFSGATQ